MYKERGMYAVLPEASIFMLFLGLKTKNDTTYTSFMQLPDLYELDFEEQDLAVFLSKRTLEFVEQLPEDVFNVCVANII
jgi:hypothetical protein